METLILLKGIERDGWVLKPTSKKGILENVTPRHSATEVQQGAVPVSFGGNIEALGFHDAITIATSSQTPILRNA
jgi:hypothetical protein